MASRKNEAVSEDILKSAANKALSEIIEIAESDSTDTKTRFDIYKWICEMHFGKPSSGSSKNDSGEHSLTLSFKGELDKWSQ